jgi:hypothetical protein
MFALALFSYFRLEVHMHMLERTDVKVIFGLGGGV